MARLAKGVLGLLLMPALFGLLLLTSGCNTMRGMGEDVEAAGEAVSGGAENTEEKIEEETGDTTDETPDDDDTTQ